MENVLKYENGVSDTTKSLRNFIFQLEQAGELIRINEQVDWKYEIGQRTRQCQKSDQKKPALLFENIKDYPGHRVFTNGLGTYSRIAIALGIDPTTDFRDIIKVFKQRISNTIEPVLVNNAPVKQNFIIGDQVDLTKLPVPWWNKKDGGRYIGTWHLNITKDPETGIRNVGIYRMQLLEPRTAAISISPRSHLAIHLTRAESNGRPLEMAVAIGVNETLIMAAAAAAPYGVDEYSLAGGLNQGPVTLTECKTVDLEVPSYSEIVIEGRIMPEIRVKEGPFLDYSGIPKEDSKALVFEVSCLIHRNNPILRGAAIGMPGAEDHLLFSLLCHAGCLDFHGSRIRQKLQNILLKKRWFKTFQGAGAFRQFVYE